MKAVLVVLLFTVLISSAYSADSVYRAFWDDFQDLDGWTAIRKQGGATNFYTCGSTKLVGGFGLFGRASSLTKSIVLPPHYQVQFKVQFWKIDSWDNEQFHVFIDQSLVFNKAYQVSQGTKICGTSVPSWTTFTEDITVSQPHTTSTVLIFLTSNLDEAADNESWGVRNIEVLVEKCPDGCVACNGPDANECKQWQRNVNSWAGVGDLDAEGWKVEGAQSKGTNCAGTTLFGGWGVFGRGAIISQQFNLPQHFRLKIKFKFMKLSSWDNERAVAQVDGTEFWGANYQYNQGYDWPVCSTANEGWKDQMNAIEVNYNHVGTTATLRITSNLDENPDNEAWGIRDFQIFTAKCIDNCAACTGASAKECSSCKDGYLMVDNQCTIDTCVYLYQECDYKGPVSKLCPNSPNFDNDKVIPYIRSVKVPVGQKVILYEQTDYKGRSVTYTQSQPCIQKFDWQQLMFVQLNEEELSQVAAAQVVQADQDELILAVNTRTQFLQ